MTQARITIGGTPGSNLSYTINTLAQLGNQNNGGETSYLWQIVDQPPGTNDSLSSTSTVNPSFTPRKEGTYLLELIVNLGQADEARNRVLLAVKQLKTGTRIPAAGEQGEAGDDGHAASVNDLLRLIDTIRADPGLVIAQAISTLTRNTVVRFAGLATLKTGLPGQESILTCDVALGNASYINVDPLGLIVGRADGSSSTVTAGQLALVRMMGLQTQCGLSGSAQSLVYVSNTGSLSSAPGSIPRRVGKLLTSSQDLLFWGYHAA